MKQEPFAWFRSGFVPMYESPISKQKENENDIPLYTEPQYRELSDEEIIEISKEFGYANRYDLNINFARAILKKASEK